VADPDHAGEPDHAYLINFAALLSSMFMHAGWFHLIGNMWALWIFGNNIEDHFGHAVYATFYLLCGAFAGMAHIYANPGSDVPTLGASGAIAGVMGAFLLRYPEARVQIFVFYGLRAGLFWVTAWVVLAFWFAVQLFWQVFTHWAFGSAQTGGIAYWAHLGGFVAGMILVKLIPGYTRYSHGGWVDKEGRELLPKQ
jgi:rhomboid family protein